MIVVTRRLDGVHIEHVPGVPNPIRPGVFVDSDLKQAEAFAESIDCPWPPTYSPEIVAMIGRDVAPQTPLPDEGHVLMIETRGGKVVGCHDDLTFTFAITNLDSGHTERQTFQLSDLARAALETHIEDALTHDPEKDE